MSELRDRIAQLRNEIKSLREEPERVEHVQKAKPRGGQKSAVHGDFSTIERRLDGDAHACRQRLLEQVRGERDMAIEKLLRKQRKAAALADACAALIEELKDAAWMERALGRARQSQPVLQEVVMLLVEKE